MWNIYNDLVVIFWRVKVDIRSTNIFIENLIHHNNKVELHFKINNECCTVQYDLFDDRVPDHLQVTFEHKDNFETLKEFHFRNFSTKEFTKQELDNYKELFECSSLLKSQKYINCHDTWLSIYKK